jgi:hypothetical protein
MLSQCSLAMSCYFYTPKYHRKSTTATPVSQFKIFMFIKNLPQTEVSPKAIHANSPDVNKLIDKISLISIFGIFGVLARQGMNILAEPLESFGGFPFHQSFFSNLSGCILFGLFSTMKKSDLKNGLQN